MSQSPREIVHFDAIHHTNLIYGVKVNVGRQEAEKDWVVVPNENEDRFHIQTICRRIADEFFAHKEDASYTPRDFANRPIHSIVTDREFMTHALLEFDGINRKRAEEGVLLESARIQEQVPPVLTTQLSSHDVVNTLTLRLVEAFQESSTESADGLGKLELARMKAIRDDVFKKAEKEKKSKFESSRKHTAITIDNGNPLRGKDEDDSCGCEPKWIAISGAFAIGLLLLNLFREPERDRCDEQKVSHIDEQHLVKGLRGGGGSIY